MNEIIPVNEKVVPTVVSFDYENNEYLIGEDAKKTCLAGLTKYNIFSMDLGETKSELNKNW